MSEHQTIPSDLRSTVNHCCQPTVEAEVVKSLGHERGNCLCSHVGMCVHMYSCACFHLFIRSCILLAHREPHCGAWGPEGFTQKRLSVLEVAEPLQHRRELFLWSEIKYLRNESGNIIGIKTTSCKSLYAAFLISGIIILYSATVGSYVRQRRVEVVYSISVLR